MKKAVGMLIILVLLGVGGIVAFAYSGIYNVAATVPHTQPVYWMLDTMTDHSIRYHARGIATPDLSEPNTMRIGLNHYNGMCVTCHGAPGVQADELSQGFYPPPPDLTDASKAFTPAQLFWTIKNGIKMTGMPAFGPTHEDDEIWAMVAVVEQLGKWDADEYQAKLEEYGVKPGTSEEHEHDGNAAAGKTP